MDSSSRTTDEPPLTHHKVLRLLSPQSTNPFIETEEQCHPWDGDHFQTFEVPFLRIWDHFSGSQPDENDRMISRAPDQRLDTTESRKESITTHLNHKDWRPTPYISFTTSAEAVEELANFRTQRNNRGVQTLTVVDPNIRLRDGLPLLDVATEMSHYGIPDPYGKSNQCYVNHYVCLWEVNGKEVVGHWPWNDLVAKKRWHEEIIMPAFKKFRSQAPVSTTGVEPDLSDFMGKLSREVSDTSYSFHEESDFSSEGYVCYDGGEDLDWDTDDEIEESNAADDMIKILEEGW